MSCPFFPERRVRLLALLGGLLAAAPAFAAPRAILPFGVDTWSELSQSRSRPLAVVFSTTDCVHCPKVIDSLADAIRKSGSGVRLAVVVMDGAGQGDALREDSHYRKAKFIYAFDGDAVALRYKVNPAWRGITPYVALVPAAGEVRFHGGQPPPDALRAFLRP
jgi:hypothetical protein